MLVWAHIKVWAKNDRLYVYMIKFHHTSYRATPRHTCPIWKLNSIEITFFNWNYILQLKFQLSIEIIFFNWIFNFQFSTWGWGWGRLFVNGGHITKMRVKASLCERRKLKVENWKLKFQLKLKLKVENWKLKIENWKLKFQLKNIISIEKCNFNWIQLSNRTLLT